MNARERLHEYHAEIGWAVVRADLQRHVDYAALLSQRGDGICAGIRAFAIAHPKLSTGEIMLVAESIGLHAETARKQTKDARAHWEQLVADEATAADAATLVMTEAL